MISNPSLLLNSGHKIPQLGLGTFDAPKEVVTEAVEVAISTGFRHIDCAMIYGNEKEVGAGIAASLKKHNLRREDIFVTSKLWCDKHAPEDVRSACELSIEKLGVQYLDLYLVHLPVSFHVKEGMTFDVYDPSSLVFEHHKLEDTWKAMEELVSAGLVKSIGVSNFNKRQLERILVSCTIPPAVNQIEVNLHWLNTKLIEFCHSKNIFVEGYGLLGSPGFMKDQAKPLLQEGSVVEIAHKHKKTPAQVLLRHGLQRGIVVLVKSVTPERIKSNFDVFNFELTNAEMEILNSTGLNKRIFLASAGKVKSLLEEANVVEIARKHGKAPAQVLLRHGLQRGIVVIVKSITPERIKANFDVFDFELTDEEMAKLDRTGVNKRLFVFEILANYPEYPFHEEF